MIDLEMAMEIARSVDPKADIVTEYKRGWHFIRKEEIEYLSDPGFAVSREDGRVLFGFAANCFLFELQGNKDFPEEEEL